MFLPYVGMAAILINGLWPFVQIFNPPLTEGSTWSLKKIGPEVSEEVIQGVDGGMDGRRTASDHSFSRLYSGALWCSGKASDLRSIGTGFDPH